MQIKSNEVVEGTCNQNIFQLKEIHHDGLRGSHDFLISRFPQNRNIMASAMVHYCVNLDHSIRYEPDVFKFRKLLQTCIRPWPEPTVVELQHSIGAF